MSRKEELVDKAEDPKSLFWKIDFLHKMQPAWLMPYGWSDRCRQKNHLINPQTGSTIDGEATTGDVAAGDRRTSIFLDEFSRVRPDDQLRVRASVHDASQSIFYVGTPQGRDMEFYRVRNSGITKITLHWTSHPVKSRGMYQTSETGKLQLLDTKYWDRNGTNDYGFILDGKKRSPWYDGECKRRNHPLLVAQEIDIDYLHSSSLFFDSDALAKSEANDIRDPFVTCEIEPISDDGKLSRFQYVDSGAGRLRLWSYPDSGGQLPGNTEYVIGIDVAMGAGSSNSTLSIWDVAKAEKVGEYSNPNIDPAAFARLAVALAWRCSGKNRTGAFLCWEANGPGWGFGKAVSRCGYGNFYYSLKNEKSSRSMVSDNPGWFSTKATKLNLLLEFNRAIKEREAIIRSDTTIRECREYVFAPDGDVIHGGSKFRDADPSGAGANHGDMVIADALGWLAHREIVVQGSKETFVPESSPYARRQAREKARQVQTRWR